MAGQRSAIVWPTKSADVPDKEGQFLIAYMPIELPGCRNRSSEAAALEACENHGKHT